MIEWLLYNSALPLLPVPLVYMGSWLVGTNKSVISIIRDGQLCFYCTGLCAVAINDLVRLHDGQKNINISFAITGIIFCLILSTFTYGVAATNSGNLGDVEARKLAWASLFTAITTTLIVALTRYFLGIV